MQAQPYLDCDKQTRVSPSARQQIDGGDRKWRSMETDAYDVPLPGTTEFPEQQANATGGGGETPAMPHAAIACGRGRRRPCGLRGPGARTTH